MDALPLIPVSGTDVHKIRNASLVLSAVREAGMLRFSELRDRIDGISEKMLAQTLRDLERDGLLVRTSRPVVPPACRLSSHRLAIGRR